MICMLCCATTWHSRYFCLASTLTPCYSVNSRGAARHLMPVHVFTTLDLAFLK